MATSAIICGLNNKECQAIFAAVHKQNNSVDSQVYIVAADQKDTYNNQSPDVELSNTNHVRVCWNRERLDGHYGAQHGTLL